MAAADDYNCEHYEQQMAAAAWGEKAAAAAVRREYEAYLRGTSSNAEVAGPEVDLGNRQVVAAHAWRVTAASVAEHLALVVGAEPEPVQLSNDVLIAQMQQAMAVGW